MTPFGIGPWLNTVHASDEVLTTSVAAKGQPHYDVAIVGASIAGCTAATFLARRGLSVALIEKTEDPNAFKKVCTHFIQSSATPTIERLGISRSIEEAGGIRNSLELWTRWGWIRLKAETHGYTIRRQKLDPMMRRLATSTAGVDYLSGREAEDLVFEGHRVCGIRIQTRGGSVEEITTRLVIGADGRNSRVAEISGLPTIVTPNNRFVYFAYYRNLPLTSGVTTQTWFLEPNLDAAYAAPVDDGLTLLAALPLKTKLDGFRSNLEERFQAYLGTLPDGPNIGDGERVSEFRGILDVPNIKRVESRPGLALVGDAALASDPLAAVGCGWAFQSAEWLADIVAEALLSKDDASVDRALNQYCKIHDSSIGPHQSVIASFSTGRPYTTLERMLYRGATSDPAISNALELLFSRKAVPEKVLTPSVLARLQKFSAEG